MPRMIFYRVTDSQKKEGYNWTDIIDGEADVKAKTKRGAKCKSNHQHSGNREENLIYNISPCAEGSTNPLFDPVEVSKNHRDVDKEKSEASHQQSKIGIYLSQFFKCKGNDM